MHNTKEAVSHTESVGFYKTLLFFYPLSYRKRFGEQMLITFHDMYQDEVAIFGKARLSFWISIFLDTTQSIIIQHINSMRQQGFRKYFHINNYNIVGGILLLPFVLIFTYGMIGRIVQNDIYRYNRAYESILSHSFIYANYFGKPLILIAIAIILPALSVFINLIPLFASIVKTKKLSPKKIILTNLIAILMAFVGLFFLLLIFGHDFVPCMVSGLSHIGAGQFGHIISVCRNA